MTQVAWRRQAVVALAAALLVEGFVRPASPAGRGHTVRITNFRFSPETLTVAVGDTLRWVNDDPFLHTISPDSASSWGSGWLARNDRYVWVPRQPGRFPYHCEAHPVMRGVLTVR